MSFLSPSTNEAAALLRRDTDITITEDLVVDVSEGG